LKIFAFTGSDVKFDGVMWGPAHSAPVVPLLSLLNFRWLTQDQRSKIEHDGRDAKERRQIVENCTVHTVDQQVHSQTSNRTKKEPTGDVVEPPVPMSPSFFPPFPYAQLRFT